MSEKIKAVEGFNVETMSATERQEFIRQAMAMMAQAQKFAAEEKSRNASGIDALRYEIWQQRQIIAGCATCNHARETAAKAHEELKSLVLTGASKVKFAEDEETTFRARYERENAVTKAAKSAK